MQNTPSGYRDLTQTVSTKLSQLRGITPQVMRAFSELGRAATTPGALHAKTKELIAWR
jgi:alkylhydroperoxidase/carboxymuconolactone decarboxylase family protein YurZ